MKQTELIIATTANGFTEDIREAPDSELVCYCSEVSKGQIIHVGFPDPAKAIGTEGEVITIFRWVRDGLRERPGHLLREKLKELPNPRLTYRRGNGRLCCDF